MNEDLRWQAVLERDRALDGAFVYAVRSTGVYCRPSCPSRRPRRDQVRFFSGPASAEAAGFRACRRCRPAGSPEEPHLELVRAACRLIEERPDQSPTLEELSAALHLSPQHLQRTFKRVVGVSPRGYAEARRVERLKRELRAGEEIGSALHGAGYGSSSRLYAQAPLRLGMTPATYRRGGVGMDIRYTIADSPLGRLLVAATERGICAVYLGDDDARLEAELAAEFHTAALRREAVGLDVWVAAIVRHLDGQQPHLDLPLDVRATAFQQRVWETLRAIPYGETRTYRAIAESLGQPGAARAVGRACATNPVSLVIPCHRAVGEDGKLHGYRWGVERKQALLERERTTGGG